MAANRRMPTFDVFVGNLPPDANEKNIGKLFISYGEIAGIFVKESPKVKGPNNKYAFVKFLCEQDADRVVAEMDRKVIEGVEITVKKTDNKKNPGDVANKKKIKGSDVEGATAFPGGGGQDIEKDKEKVLITHVENPCAVWLQIVNEENTAKIFNITEQLGSLCPAAKKVTGQPDLGKVYGCLYTEDNMWYRCQVKQCFGTDKYKIQYIDYGNTEEVGASSLVEIPPNVGNIRAVAVKVILHNVKAKDIGDKQALQFLKSITDNQMALLQRVRPLADNCGFYGNIFVQDQSIGDVMVQAGYCTQMKYSFGNRSNQPPGPGLEVLQQPPPLAVPAFNNIGSQRQQQQQQLQQPPPMNMGYKIQANTRDNSKELQTELKKRNSELEMMKTERDSASRQVEYMRSQIKTVQEEFAMAAAKLQEDTLSRRVSNVMKLATMVRHLRQQFPTDSKPCLLDEAITMCSETDKIDQSKYPSLAVVGSALNRYKAAQDEIKKCKEMNEMSDLIESRDEARRELYEKLSLCLDELETLPIEQRSKQVEGMQQQLSLVYSEYISLPIKECPAIKLIASGFKVWKSKKDAEFTDVRTASTFTEGALQTALAQLQQCLSVSANTQCEKSEVDLDELMKTYAHALQREINVTDLVHNKDAGQVATVIAAVRRELQSEASTLENLRMLQKEFRERRQSIEPWLNAKPSFADVQENRKLLRSLKSKLRHILADKLDLEESGSEGELDNVKEEEDKIRQQIQAALAKADSLQHEVADLAETNFPEMMVQYPDLGIDGYSVFKGLVKANREIDHYQLDACLRPGLHLSSFNNDPVIIQEFHVGDNDHCSREVFLNQVLAYTGDTGIIQAVFFSKSERQVYVQGAWQNGGLVETIVKETVSFTPHQLQQMSLQLVKHMASLHQRGVYHGEISPQAIIINHDKSVSMLWPDFSKTLAERLNKRYSTENGLVFQCLDQQSVSPESHAMASDIYNLVLLLFWLHCPDQNAAKRSGTSPDPRKRLPNIDPSLQQLFEDVLCGRKAGRMAAEMIAALDYFQKTLPDTNDPPPLVVPSPPPHTQGANSIPGPDGDQVPGPMEIGVFRAEDYIVAEAETIPVGADTDDSWTTKSSTSASRTSSPLDTVQGGGDTGGVSVTESVTSVIEADVNSGGDTVISGEVSEDGDALGNDDSLTADLHCDAKQLLGHALPQRDIFSQAQFSDYLGCWDENNVGDKCDTGAPDTTGSETESRYTVTDMGAACDGED